MTASIATRALTRCQDSLRSLALLEVLDEPARRAGGLRDRPVRTFTAAQVRFSATHRCLAVRAEHRPRDGFRRQLLAGLVHDLDGRGEVFSVEASRRLSDRWRVEPESRIWCGTSPRDTQYPVRRDDYVMLRPLHNF